MTVSYNDGILTMAGILNTTSFSLLTICIVGRNNEIIPTALHYCLHHPIVAAVVIVATQRRACLAGWCSHYRKQASNHKHTRGANEHFIQQR